MLQPLMIGQRPTPSLSSHFGSRRAWKFASQAYSAIPLLHSLSMSPQLASPRQVCGEWPSTGQKGGQIESRFDTYTVKPDKQLDRRDLGLLQSVADPSRPTRSCVARNAQTRDNSALLRGLEHLHRRRTGRNIQSSYIGHAWTVTSDKDAEPAWPKSSNTGRRVPAMRLGLRCGASGQWKCHAAQPQL